MILTDREIKIAIERRLVLLDPLPDPNRAFSSTALDLTLDGTLRVFARRRPGVAITIDPGQEDFDAQEALDALTRRANIGADGYLLEPNLLVLAWTAERLALDIGTRLAARVEGKSSLARLGLAVHVTAPTIHAGFSGQIQLEVINHGALPIRLRRGMRICQLIVETTLGTPERGYQGQFLNQAAAPRKARRARRPAGRH